MYVNEEGRIEIGKGVTLNPFKPRPLIKREYMTDADIMNNVGTDLIMDGEFYPNYALFGFKSVKTKKYIRADRAFNPRFLSWLMFSYRTIGFNSIHFDIPMLWAAFVNQNPEWLKEVANQLILSGKRSKEIAKEYGFDIYKLPERQHIDLFNVCPGKHSLKLYGARLHCKRIQDLPFPDTQVLTDAEIEHVADYNCNDLDVTEDVFLFNKERLELREHISQEYNVDLMSKSDAQMAEVVISKEVAKKVKKFLKPPTIEAGTTYKYYCPQYISYATKPMQDLLSRVKKADFVISGAGKIIPPQELEEPVKVGNNYYSLGVGGLHSKDKCKFYKAGNGKRLKDIDVTSYYPNAILNMKLTPIALGPTFLDIYGGFKIARVDAKKNHQFTKDKGLKIFLNGASGKFSDPYSNLYSPHLTIQMNITGQLSILMLAEMFECNGIEVVSANTDGVLVYYNDEDEEKVNYWIKFWENLTKFDLEPNDYKMYCARDVNAYFAVKDDGKVKIKGPYSEVGSQTGTKLDNNPITLVCTDAIEKFLSKGLAIEETILNCKDITRFIVVRQVKGGAAFRGDYLGKTVRWYYSKNSYDAIQYTSNGNKVADSLGAMPVMDLPDEFPSDINYQYYLDKCKDTLYDVGYYKRPEQISFF